MRVDNPEDIKNYLKSLGGEGCEVKGMLGEYVCYILETKYKSNGNGTYETLYTGKRLPAYKAVKNDSGTYDILMYRNDEWKKIQ